MTPLKRNNPQDPNPLLVHSNPCGDHNPQPQKIQKIVEDKLRKNDTIPSGVKHSFRSRRLEKPISKTGNPPTITSVVSQGMQSHEVEKLLLANNIDVRKFYHPYGTLHIDFTGNASYLGDDFCYNGKKVYFFSDTMEKMTYGFYNHSGKKTDEQWAVIVTHPMTTMGTVYEKGIYVYDPIHLSVEPYAFYNRYFIDISYPDYPYCSLGNANPVCIPVGIGSKS